jgi:hypothetical protein
MSAFAFILLRKFIRMINPMRVMWVGNLTSRMQIRNVYTIFEIQREETT